MHLATMIISLLAAWRYGDWKNWQKYSLTMLYVAMSNLLYNFLYADHLLWKLEPDFPSNPKLGELFYTFIVFPSTALLLLTNYPKEIKKQILRISKFVIIYVLVEYIFFRSGRIIYHSGWNIWWSLAWLCMMFPMMVLHQKKPLITYIVSVFLVVLVLFLFPIPMK